MRIVRAEGSFWRDRELDLVAAWQFTCPVPLSRLTEHSLWLSAVRLAICIIIWLSSGHHSRGGSKCDEPQRRIDGFKSQGWLRGGGGVRAGRLLKKNNQARGRWKIYGERYPWQREQLV